MVARDGIEPPTPAFSGPRSTTELPGLSCRLQVAISCAGCRRSRLGGSVHGQLLQQLCKYINSVGTRQTHRPRGLGAAIVPAAASKSTCFSAPGPYTGKHLCLGYFSAQLAWPFLLLPRFAPGLPSRYWRRRFLPRLLRLQNRWRNLLRYAPPARLTPLIAPD